MSKTFQRTNWSNEQILHFLDGQKIVNGAGEVDEHCQEFNDVVDDIKEFFRGFTVSEEEFGAMGYCVEEDAVYHIGALPEGEPIKKCAIAHSPEIQQLAETHWKPLGGICVPFQNVRRKPIAEDGETVYRLEKYQGGRNSPALLTKRKLLQNFKKDEN